MADEFAYDIKHRPICRDNVVSRNCTSTAPTLLQVRCRVTFGHQPEEQDMATDPKTKTRENRLRRKAGLYGLRLSKSPRRDPDALDYGLYALIDDQTNFTVNPCL